MTDLDQKLLTASLGEKRLNPDQQRYCLGTFPERIVLTISIDDASKEKIIQIFPKILENLQTNYPNLAVKISARLNNHDEMTYMKAAQNLHLQATIIDEDKAESPYGVVVHSDQAINIVKTDIKDAFSKLLVAEPCCKEKKVSFFKKLFHPKS